MSATFRDYHWVENGEFEWLDAYCITLFQGASIEAVLEALSGQRVGIARGADDLSQQSYAHSDAWNMQAMARALGLLGEPNVVPEQFMVGLFALEGWCLMLEINGFLGVSHDAIGPISRGSKVVSHFRNVNAYDAFHYWVDGSAVVKFEPHGAGYADGPPDVLAEIDLAGFEISGLNPNRPVTSAAFALAERLTGVRLTLSMLTGAEFTTALVALSP